METQRERTTEEGTREDATQPQQLPPPPEAFPITEYSQLQSQLRLQSYQTANNASSTSPFTSNPFGDSNAVSATASLSAPGSLPPPNLFSEIANALAPQRLKGESEEQSTRGETESLAPPPEYQEHQGAFVATGIELEAGLPSYDAAEIRDLGAEKDEAELDAEQDARLQGRPLESSAFGMDEKADLKKAEEHQRTLLHQHIADKSEQPSSPREMEEKKHIELRAIAEALSRAYASSPQLDAQRYATPPSRQGSALSGSMGETGSSLRASGDASVSVSDTASFFAHPGRTAARKGKERASESSLESDVVMVGGRRMTKEDEAELKKIWDQIERAHGYRLGEQSHTVDPTTEAERRGRQKEAFYRELLKKTGEGRLRSQDHSPAISTSNRVYNQTQGSHESLALLNPPAPSAIAWNQSFAPIHTPESQRSSPGIFNMLRTDGRESGEGPNLLPSGERRPSEEEMLSMQDFLGKEEKLVTMQEFLSKEMGRGK
ncbi:hypothetical protein QFC21_004857 [Naganishia friedmannii]|uniref:Uncharacterized protein n=1 Tax=Naganishia friedmannii TaxID=89922 RepID=A0ACC2VDN8_9TREE|nr:hypothetical protein QFC21_004857 [Naganishia friedmannii]